MKTGVALLLAGAGAMLAYQKYKDGSMDRTFNKVKQQAQNKLENMRNS